MSNVATRLSIVGSVLLSALIVLILSAFGPNHQQPPLPDYLQDSQPADLPLPSTLPIQDYERLLYTWLMNFEYQKLNWAVDKEVRDTGLFVNNTYYGTHPAVRIHYSPGVIEWLRNGREGDIPDGAMIIKEMYTPPATLYQELEQDPRYKDNPEAYNEELNRLLASWTVMIRDSQGSHDGWYWGSVDPPTPGKGLTITETVTAALDDYSHILYSEFGAPCLRCHASAESGFTFSTLENIEGFSPEDAPLRFYIDNSWRTEAHLQGDPKREHYPLRQLLDDPYGKSLASTPAEQIPWPLTSTVRSFDHHDLPDHTTVSQVVTKALAAPNSAFLEIFPQISPVPAEQVRKFPMQWADHVVPGPNGPEHYLTSDNCLGCHGGLGGSPGPTMFIETGPGYGDGYNVSEYGEWRWSPMGLAGRDPIFHAQIESEMALLEQDAETGGLLKGPLTATQKLVTNTCLSCHGGMGQRQLAIDAATDDTLDSNFDLEYFYLTEKLSSTETEPDNYRYHKYGELARDGISCMMCHHMVPPTDEEVAAWDTEAGWVTDETDRELAYLLFHQNTGRYETGPANEVYGPFRDVAEMPMQQSLGITPVHSSFITDSQLCGTCYNINLPNIGADQAEEHRTDENAEVITNTVLTAAGAPGFEDYRHSIEQATFLEWQNSVFGTEGHKRFQSCQDCHMLGGFESLDGDINIEQLVTQIATIQDTNYPQAENELPAEELDIPLRENYKRHEHVGLNVFLLEMFNQFPSILGVAETDYMTSASNGNQLALENMVRQARQDTVTMTVESLSVENDTLTADVYINNKTGHRFPSGVAFRRAFVEFLVYDGEDVVWASGRTNSVGVIVDGDGQPLQTEFLPDADSYQRHHQVITREDQVQIYEELTQNVEQEFTTSFIHRVYHIKDNRLLPDGWLFSSAFKEQGEVMETFMKATDPHGTGNDPDYINRDNSLDFIGGDRLQYVVTLPDDVDPANLSVKATIYSQAIPPYWLHDRFTTAPEGEGTQRLYYLTSHLNLEGTPMEDWKLELVSATAQVE